MESLKAAVIGAGSMGQNHLRVFSELEGVDLVAVAEKDKALAGGIAKRFGIASYKGADKMLAVEKPDVVTCAVPTQSHTKVALSCIREGANLLVEKPIADNLKNAKKLIKAKDQADVKVMVGHIERFNPAINELKKRLMKKRLGRIFSMNATRVGPFPARIRDVGVVIDLSVHDIDIMCYLADSEVNRVYAGTEKRIHTRYKHMLSGLLKFRNGSVGVLDVNWLTPEKIREITVTGEKGMFQAKYLTQELYFHENRKAHEDTYAYPDILMGVTEGDITQVRISKKEPLKAELEAFTEAVRKDKPEPVTCEQGYHALEIALAMNKSATKNQVINI